MSRLRLAVPSPVGWCLLFAMVAGYIVVAPMQLAGIGIQTSGTLIRVPLLGRTVQTFRPAFVFVGGARYTGFMEVADVCPSL